MAEEHETFMHRWFDEVWNKRRAEAVDEMFAEDGIGYGLPTESGDVMRGPKDFKVLHRNFLAAYPDLTVTVDDVVVSGDKISARCTVRGTHTGDGLGLAATNQPVEFTGQTFAIMRDGKFFEVWNEFDFMKMYSQLGALTLNLQ